MPDWVCEQATFLLSMQWGPKQMACKLPVSHGALYQHVYAGSVRTCAAKSKRESATPAGVSDEAKSVIGVPLVIDLLISKLECKGPL